jgi:hypothetical protein
MSEWQPIATAPKDREVLVYDDGAILISLYVRDEDGQEGWWDHGFMDPAPSHWMPVPDPPRDVSWAEAQYTTQRQGVAAGEAIARDVAKEQ